MATSYSGTVHFTSSDPQAVLPADAALNNGTGQFSATLNTIGSQSLTVTDTANAALAGVQTGLQVVPLASISGPSVGALNQALTFTLGPAASPRALSSPSGSTGTATASWTRPVTGPSGTTVTHSYATASSYAIGVTAPATRAASPA